MSKRRIHLLLVEDDPADAYLTQSVFEELGDVQEISVVQDGAEALAYLRGEGRYAEATRPDLILLDLNMPRMNGLEFLDIMKRDPLLHRIPVLVFSTSSRQEDVQASYDRHANTYLRKPTLLEDYEGLVRAVQVYWMQHAELPAGN